MGSNILPLRMSSIERFHFYDDSPEYPNNILAKFYFAGRLDEETARTAFEVATARHPLMQSIVKGKFWHSPHEIGPRFLWNRGTTIASQWLNLEVERSCRLMCNYDSDADETEVLFQAHHAAVDGQGGLQFFRDWMKVYDNIVAEKPREADLLSLCPTAYTKRNRLEMLRIRNLWKLMLLPIGCFGAFKFSFRKVTPLIRLPKLDDDTLKSEFPETAAFEITKSQMAKVKAYVKKEGITLNDWLVSCCYRSLMCWRERFGQHSSSDWYRVIIPMSIRSMHDRDLPACNRVAIIQLDRREETIVDVDTLNQSVNRELGVIRNAELQKIFLMMIKLFSVIPFSLKARACQQKSLAMTLLTNVGRPMLKTGLEKRGLRVAMGGAELKRFELVPPIRYGTPITFAASQYAGELSLTMHVDTRFIQREHAVQLLNDLGHRITKVQQE